MYIRFLLVILVLLCGIGCTETYTQQTVQGEFAGHGGQQLKLMGYRGFETYVIDSARADEKGNFVLRFGEADYGMGSLLAADGKLFMVILAPDEGLKLKGESISMPQTIQILSGKQNQLFEQYASEHIRREQVRSAWDYLDRIYQQDSLFMVNSTPRKAITNEIARIKKEDEQFLKGLEADTYVRWFLPLRKLVSSVSTVAQYRTVEIPETLEAFRTMDYTDERLFKSGLLGDAIEAHFWLIENSGRSLDSVYVEMNHSIDLMLENLANDAEKFNAVTQYLFELLERRSLFTSSEYLAVKVLNETSCTLDEKLASQLESYRAMKKGTTAPDFVLGPAVLAPAYAGKPMPAKLSEIAADYYLIVFGASWCPACPEELNQLAAFYPKWREQGVAVVFVSLDEDETAFRSFAGRFQFVSITDYKRWEGKTVKDYHVFATPTMYLLDKRREILLRPNSARHMDSWVEWFLNEK